MKTDKKLVVVAYILTFIMFMFSAYVDAGTLDFAWNNQIELEIVWPDSMHSEHDGQCDPWCANQDNGGRGFILHFKRLDKHLNLAVGRIDLINSYGDQGSVAFFQPHAVDVEAGVFKASFAFWFMRITGYRREIRTNKYYIDENGEYRNVKEYKEIVVNTPPWPVFRFCANPLYKFTDDFQACYRFLKFPIVKIDFVTFSYKAIF